MLEWGMDEQKTDWHEAGGREAGDGPAERKDGVRDLRLT